MKYHCLTSWHRICILILASLIGSCFMPNVCHAGQTSTSGKVYQGITLVVRLNFKPLPEQMPGSQDDTPEMVELGRKLFFERDISLTKSQSCNDCHRLDHQQAGVDNHPTSKGAKGIPGERNSPTVLNAGFEVVQFWDGRSANLVEQAKGPLLNPMEMAMRTEEDVVNVLKNKEDYRRYFERAFPSQTEPVTFDNVARAIAAFERTLITPSRFDRYLKGEKDALTAAEQRGLHRFVETGCIDCHSSYPVGGHLLRKFGVYHPYENQSDLGRYGITGQEADKFVFKVPSLRNVTLTAPYFHDGRVSTLSEAVRLMAWMQLNKVLSPPEVDEIVSFLHTLEAEHPLNVRQP
jgi:cytochrome c peroxidase